MERDHPLDIARAVSVLYIVGFWHLFGYSEMIDRMPYGDYLKNATLATFIFISGYFLSKKYLIKSFESLLSYLVKRIVRLIPLYALALFSYYIVGFISLRTSILSLTGFSTLIPPQPPTLWFVSMILIFYYLFPILSGRKQLIQGLLALLILGVAFLVDHYFLNIDRRFFYYWPCFAIGVILGRNNFDTHLKSLRFFVIISLLFIGFSMMHLKNYGGLPQWIYRDLISLSGAFFILSLSHLLSQINIVIKGASVLSYLSMAAYLFHRQILDIIEKYVYWPPDGWFRASYLIFICLPVVLLVGYVVQKLYDLLTHEMLKHFGNARD